ncbi:sodium:solute symporter family protein [Propionibacteriaceae bacterium Y1700]|uniref:sodium:solute symporter family protein n=1 Tax=Microlunatus sp. Y1700 TaxID=3418487 RepID=UPI003DA77075
METLDWIALGGYFVLVLGIGLWAKRRVADTKDFYVGGGRVPWWLSGISHHMSGYSAVVFTGFAAIAYSTGVTIYLWWAIGIAFGTFVAALIIAPAWARLSRRFGAESPLEYLEARYGLPVQQVLGWSGSLLNLIADASKFAGMGIILSVVAGIDLNIAIIVSGLTGLFYAAAGGLWADLLTDFAQFVVQFIAGVAMFVIVAAKLGGLGNLLGVFGELPPSHSNPLADPYTLAYVLPYFVINFFSYAGGTWNLAQRFMSASRGSDARKAAMLSSGIYIVWPLVLFFPMWAAPLLLPDLAEPTHVYAIMTRDFLPAGLVGLVVAAVFAHTMAMTTSDANAVSSVVTRDLLPRVITSLRGASDRVRLMLARMVTVTFSALAVLIAINLEAFGGIIDLMLEWFAGLIGPISVPMILGLVPVFRRAGQATALVSIFAGLFTFVLVKYLVPLGSTPVTTYPILVSLTVFLLGALVGHLLRRPVSDEVEAMMVAVRSDEDPEPAQSKSGQA